MGVHQAVGSECATAHGMPASVTGGCYSPLLRHRPIPYAHCRKSRYCFHHCVKPVNMSRNIPRAVLVGEESLLVQCAQAWTNRGFEIEVLVSALPAARQWAASHGVRWVETVDGLAGAAPGAVDFLLSITNLQILPPALLALPRRAAINFHDGPLPAYGGLNTPVWALVNGETRHGITWHRMTEAVDRGAILVERSLDIDAEETALSLNTKCFAAAIDAFDELMGLIERDDLQGVAQSGPIGRLYSRRDRPDALLDPAGAAASATRLVRALDFGSYANPVASALLWLGEGRLCTVGEAQPAPDAPGAEPGTVLAAEADSLTVAFGDGALTLARLRDLQGGPLTAADCLALAGLRPDLPGQRLPLLGAADREALASGMRQAAGLEALWTRRLRQAEPLDLPLVDRTRPAGGGAMSEQAWPLDAAQAQALRLAAGVGPEAALAPLVAASWLVLLGRLADKSRFDIGLDASGGTALRPNLAGFFALQLPLPVALDWSAPFSAVLGPLRAELDRLQAAAACPADLALRRPDLRGTPAATGWSVSLAVGGDALPPRPATGLEFEIRVAADGRSVMLRHDASRLDAQALRSYAEAWQALLAALGAAPQAPIGRLSLLGSERLHEVLETWNPADDASVALDRALPAWFDDQARRTPEQVAVRCADAELSYDALRRRANQLAHRLIALGVGPDTLVGLYMTRSVDLMVAAVAVHKAGGAYVPLDPLYPADRIAFMVEDARLPVLLTQQALLDELPPHRAEVLCVDADWPTVAGLSDEAPPVRARPEHLAYVIYTSGSTGRPKGVMVEHRNVVNFFAGIDRRLGDIPGRVWLAVTSLSFDISVLELFWTLTRGFTVIMSSEDTRATAGVERGAAAARPLDFSLFYFSSDEAERGADKYRLLMEGARYADRHGFSAVWTPERHFHAFGGLYPNPSVTSAAVAAITQRVKIRSGSVVLPLHHPARIAEEWSVVDNLSNGRVGLSFASGWQPNDFTLKPENFRNNKQVLLDGIETVRRLWRGESVEFPGALGEPVAIRTLPRPVQAELPVWVTSAGNAETFRAAGRLGANVLTHLLGQTVDELADKIAAYRDARREAGFAGDGHVSLMLHSFVAPDLAFVRETVRRPLIEYLRSSVSLVKQYAWSFPAFKRREGMDTSADSVDLQSLSTEEMDALLEHSFERYFDTSGLFGTPESCLALVDRIKAVGVDEVACLIDFGVASDTVLAHLPHLNRLRKLATPTPASAVDHSVPALLARHPVTHLQCTPSMARLLADNEHTRAGFARLQCMMVGGEAFPVPLAADLQRLMPAEGRLFNMYGPTETTIWSAVQEVKSVDGGIPLGQPLVNQQLRVLDTRQQPLPPGFPGELVIGGKGVVRGYLNRPELTAERFLPDGLRPGSGSGSARFYRTGDLVRNRRDGAVEFLGRLDHQVKVRGYRIELGEIESALLAFPGVAEAVVVAREDTPGDVRLVGYWVAAGSVAAVDAAALRSALRERLPEFMVPAHLVALPALPQTPNGKIDRKALPPPQGAVAAAAGGTAGEAAAYQAPAGDLEQTIAEVWRDVLKLAQVGVRDNFFDLGGHSLLAVQAHRRLREALQVDLAITDIFRFPTIEALSRFLGQGPQPAAAAAGLERAAGRRAALQRRQGARPAVPTRA